MCYALAHMTCIW